MIWIGLASCGDKISQEYNTLGYQIIDSGKHDYLINKSEEYKSLYQNQLK